MLSVTCKPFMLTVIMLNVVRLSVTMLNVVTPSVIMLSVIMLSVIMLNVIMLSVIMPSVLAPYRVPDCHPILTPESGFQDKSGPTAPWSMPCLKPLTATGSTSSASWWQTYKTIFLRCHLRVEHQMLHLCRLQPYSQTLD